MKVEEKVAGKEEGRKWRQGSWRYVASIASFTSLSRSFFLLETNQKRMYFPELCSVCATSAKGTLQWVPDRHGSDPPYTYETLCPLCLDEFLGVYPVLHRLLSARELTGRQSRRPCSLRLL